MQIERLQHFADPANHKLPEELIEIFSEWSGDFKSRGMVFSEENFRWLCTDKQKELVSQIGFDNIRDEMFARSVFNGAVENEFWG